MMNNTEPNHATERYDAILTTAEKLFGERGYQSVSLEEIARTAGVSKGLVTYHFHSKEDLLFQILTKNRGALSEKLDQIAENDNPTRAKIRAAVQVYLDAAGSGLAIAQMALVAFFESAYTERIRNLLLDSLEENLLKFAALIEQGIANGELKPVDSIQTTHFVIGMALEMIRVANAQQQPLEAERIADEITSLLFDGIVSESLRR